MEKVNIVQSKQIRQRLGTFLLDLRYVPETIFLIEKVGSDDYVGVLCNPEWLREQGVEIPEKGSTPKAESKPDAKKKK